MSAPVRDPIAEGRAALRHGDAAAAREAFGQAPPSAETFEGLARAGYIERAYPQAVADWEKAYALHRESGDAVGAVRVARTLGYMYHAIVGDHAVGSGWLSRATSLLDGASDSREAGWVSLNRGMFEGSRDCKEELFREALRLGRENGDSDLEFVALAYLGASLVHGDRTAEGMRLLDEALAAVAGSDVDDFCVVEEIFCQLFSACEHAHDVTRADQWIRIGEAVAARRKLPAVSAFCNTHYGAVLTAAGRWPEADAALTEAVRLWGLGQRSLRGGALVRLADLRVLQGRYEDAEQLLQGLDAGVEGARPLAAIHLARGEHDLATEVLERALSELDAGSTTAAPLLLALVAAHLAAGRVEAAAEASDTLTDCATRHPSPYLVGAAALARARLCLAAGDGDPQSCFRQALTGFAEAQLPGDLALTRLELATSVAAQAPALATAEARAALETFERLQANRHADEAVALLRRLGVRTPSHRPGRELLTKREAEILELLGHGLSNPEISDRLFISRKTVEHHVGNILAKLNLRNRAAAASFAVREKPGRE